MDRNRDIEVCEYCKKGVNRAVEVCGYCKLRNRKKGIEICPSCKVRDREDRDAAMLRRGITPKDYCVGDV